MKRNILLTGRPGIGKTTAIKKIVEKLAPEIVRGFLSYEIRESGKRVGFAIETLDGEKGILAHINLRTGFKVGKYQVSVKDIDSIIIPELQKARELNSVIIIDEIAKMELFSNLFANEIRRCLDTKQVIGTIQERRHPFLDEVKSRYDVHLIELTTANRDHVPLQVLKILKI